MCHSFKNSSVTLIPVLLLVAVQALAGTGPGKRRSHTRRVEIQIQHNTSRQQKIYPFNDPHLPIDKRVVDLLNRLTLKEKTGFMAGSSFWTLRGIERLGVPSLQVTDCGHGITVILDKDGNYTGCASSFPTAVGQAATWNPELIAKQGAAIAEEARATGSSILLGPMINIHRVPVGGRNYETYSEDPYLVGEMATAFIQGLQSKKIGAVVKGFVANNQQKDQEHLNEVISKDALNNIYFPAFKTVLKRANPVGIMMSYNSVNGGPTTQSSYLINDLIKNEWNFKGFTISDWRSVVSSQSINANLDIEMPGPGKFMNAQGVEQALVNGALDEAKLNAHVSRCLRAIIRSGLIDRPRPVLPAGLNTPQHQQIAREVAENSIVLLKNEGGILPLNKNAAMQVAVFGPNASTARLGGGGSASVTSCYSVSPLEGLRNNKGKNLEIQFFEGGNFSGNLPAIPEDYLSARQDGKEVKGLQAEYYDGLNLAGDTKCTRIDPKVDFAWGWASPCTTVNKGAGYSVRWTGKIHAPEAGNYKLGMAFQEAGVRLYLDGKLVIDEWGDPKNEVTEASFLSKEKLVDVYLEQGSTHDVKIEFHKKGHRNLVRLEWEQPGHADAIAEAAALAAKSKVAIVFAGLSNLFEGGNNDKTSLDLPGNQNQLISAIAAANPNTIVVLNNGTPLAMPWIHQVKAVVEAFYPGEEGGNAIARILYGDVNPSGKLPDTYPVHLSDVRAMQYYPGNGKETTYGEGELVGYRQFEADGIKPLFPFGFGLSYTSFKLSNLKVGLLKNGSVQLNVNVSNTGKTAGAEVVEVYIQSNTSGKKPFKQLKGFRKVMLKPGESQQTQIILPADAFDYYNAESDKWYAGKGDYQILVGNSSDNIVVKKSIELE